MRQATPNSGLLRRMIIERPVYSGRARQAEKAPRRELEVRLAGLQQEYAELRTEVFEAAQVHRRLCAPRQVRFGDFEIASEIFAVRHLPGDFFTVTEKSDGVMIALGDICGKGLAASMWMPHMVGLVGARVTVSSRPEAVVAGVNRDVCLLKSFMPLASLFLARLDPGTGVVQYCSAGHPPALLLRASGELKLLSEGGLLLGVVAGAAYTSGSFQLGPGDTLLIYSDGITESLNHAGEEFGHRRLEDHLRRAARGAADAALFSVLGAVQDFAAASPTVDDMSLAIIRRDDKRQGG